jgi:hypothetical protein
MVLAQPETTDHKCESDQFIVTGGAPVPAICGTNTGAHSKISIYPFIYLYIYYVYISSETALLEKQSQTVRYMYIYLSVYLLNKGVTMDHFFL